MDINAYQLVIPTGEISTLLGSLIWGIWKLNKELKKSRKRQKDDILQEAKSEVDLVKSILESEISLLKADLENLELNVKKDIAHTKEIYSSEIKNLGEKIELLRADLSAQHAGILNLLTKLIDKT